MPLVYRSEESFTRLVPIVDVIVNPTHVTPPRGSMGGGISKELSQMFSGLEDEYKKKVESKELSLNNRIHEFITKNTNQKIVNLVTREIWSYPNTEEEIYDVLIILKEYISKLSPGHTVAMPILGIGYGNKDYDSALPIFKDVLDDLEQIIHLSMRPSYFTTPPKYLAIVGSRGFKTINLYRDLFDEYVKEALDHWNVSLDDFEAIISGGAYGVDEFACGRSMNHYSYTESYAHRNGIRSLIAQADWDRFKNSAGYIRNRTVIDIATHAIFILDKGSRSPGTRNAMSLMKAWNKKSTPGNKKLGYIFMTDSQEKE